MFLESPILKIRNTDISTILKSKQDGFNVELEGSDSSDVFTIKEDLRIGLKKTN